MKMRDLLSVEQIIPSLRAANKQDVLSKLVAHAASTKSLAAAVLRRSVLRSDELPVFGPAIGVSLPHAFVTGLRDPLVTFAKLDPAVDFGAPDGFKTDLVALLLSPADDATNHLQALACLARTLRDPFVRDMLGAASTRDSICAILWGFEESYWPRKPSITESEPSNQQSLAD